MILRGNGAVLDDLFHQVGHATHPIQIDFLPIVGRFMVVRMLTGEHVERYLVRRSKGITRQSMQHVDAHLRAF